MAQPDLIIKLPIELTLFCRISSVVPDESVVVGNGNCLYVYFDPEEAHGTHFDVREWDAFRTATQKRLNDIERRLP